MNKFRLLLLLIVLFSGCSQTDTETANNVANGQRTEYHEDGSIKTISNWKDGKAHGKVTHYYPNKQIEVEANYIAGKEEGASIAYHPNGAVHKKVTYRNGRLVGEAMFYTETGQLYERDIYDHEGNLIYVLKLDKEGRTREEMVVPVVIAAKDTVASGKAFEGKVRFGYSIPGEIAVFTGTPDKTGQHLQDTIFMKRLDDKTFSFSVPSYKKGYNVLPVIVMYNPASVNDTLALDGVAITYPYFVK